MSTKASKEINRINTHKKEINDHTPHKIINLLPIPIQKILESKKEKIFTNLVYKGIDNTFTTINNLESKQEIYIGQTTESFEFEGKGTFLKFNPPSEYTLQQGYFENSKLQGKGIFLTKQRIYTGNFKQGKIMGNGEIENILHNWIYKGKIEKNLPNGEGRIEYSNGNIYIGMFNKGEKEGFGTMIWKDGKKYRGNWENDTMEGKGMLTWPDGRRYEGEFRNGVREGQGKFFFRDGAVFQGRFLRGMEHGKGVLVRPGKGVLHGVWMDGVKRRNFVFKGGWGAKVGLAVGDFRLHPDNAKGY